MFRITGDPSSGILVQSLAKNNKNNHSCNQGALYIAWLKITRMIILVICSQALYKAP